MLSPTELLSTARPWAEFFYFIGGIVLALASAFAFQQVRLLKQDMRTRSQRATSEKAIEYASRYLTVYVPLQGKYRALFGEDHTLIESTHLAHTLRALWSLLRPDPRNLGAPTPFYRGQVGDFTVQSLTRKELLAVANRPHRPELIASLNELNAIAAAFMTGVADERVGFETIGRSYCDSVRSAYDFLCVARQERSHPYYQYIVELYRLWIPRLSAK
jgi:hypothetical protein